MQEAPSETGAMAWTSLTLKHGLVLFWALWLSIAWVANLCDGLKASSC